MYEIKKIGIVKRASAWLLDAILLAVLTTGLMWIISLICDFDGQQKVLAEYQTAWQTFQEEYVPTVAEYYGFDYAVDGETGDVTVTKDGKASSLAEVMQALVDSEGGDEATKPAYDAYQLLPPAGKVTAQTNYLISLLFVMISVGLLLSYFLLEFLLPLFLKNGQTVGKKVFSIGLVRPDCVRINNIALFTRTMIGKFAVETMFPILLVYLFFFQGLGIVAIILLAALLLLNIILFFVTKNRTPIHDIFASTVAVDLQLQMIYSSEDELVESKTSAHREDVENTRSENTTEKDEL